MLALSLPLNTNMMENTAIMVSKGLLEEEDSICTPSKESMGLFKSTDEEGYETYAAYWTNGREMLTCQTYDDDKKSAEWMLNYAVVLYWKNKLNKVAKDSDYDTIHSMIAKHYSRKDFGE